MSFYSFNQEDFDGWKRGIARSCHLPGWHVYDTAIKTSLAAYRGHNGGRSGYIGPSWQLIKAVLWVEGGGPGNAAWRAQPMQIGWKNDPGILDVLTKPGIGLVTPPEFRRRFGMASIKTVPEINIQAGLALLHYKLAVIVRKPWTPSFSSPMGSSDFGVAEPKAEPALPGHSAYKRAFSLEPRPEPQNAHQSESYICAWLPFCPVTLYQRYNVGDGAYARKLEYCMELMAGHTG